MSGAVRAALEAGPAARQAMQFMKQHRERIGYDPAALRCAYGDAAHVIDAMREDLRPPRPLRGVDGQIAEAVARALKAAADTIWAMRDEVSASAVTAAAREGSE